MFFVLTPTLPIVINMIFASRFRIEFSMLFSIPVKMESPPRSDAEIVNPV